MENRCQNVATQNQRTIHLSFVDEFISINRLKLGKFHEPRDTGAYTVKQKALWAFWHSNPWYLLNAAKIRATS